MTALLIIAAAATKVAAWLAPCLLIASAIAPRLDKDLLS